MNDCCLNAYKICEPFANCFDLFKVKVPDFTGLRNGIELRNGQNQGNIFSYTDEDIVDGFVTCDLALLPEGFLNPAGNPYTIRFLNNDQTTITFTDIDGEAADGIIFEIGNLSFIGLEDYTLEINAMP